MFTRATVLFAVVSFVIGIQTYQLSAGGPGTVTIPPVIEVNAIGVGTATDGTGGYIPYRGIGTGYLNRAVTVSGNSFTYSARRNPSRAVGDSAVTITYRGPLVGEAEISVTATCTVVQVVLDRAPAYRFIIETPRQIYVFAAIFPVGRANPAGLGRVTVTSTPSGGTWYPNPAETTLPAGSFGGVMVTRWTGSTGDPTSILGSFTTVASYAGISSNTQQSVLRTDWGW